MLKKSYFLFLILVVAYPFTSNADNSIHYTAYIFEDSGWSDQDVLNAINQTGEVYLDQCNTEVKAKSIKRIRVPQRFHILDEQEQASLLNELQLSPPLVFFINRSIDNYQAFSYLIDAPTPSRGTSWLTRAINPGCYGRTLAHELGHILLHASKHSNDETNLMSFKCTSSNFNQSNRVPNSKLTDTQCDQLKKFRLQ